MHIFREKIITRHVPCARASGMADRHMVDNSPSGVPPKDDDTIMISSWLGSTAKEARGTHMID